MRSHFLFASLLFLACSASGPEKDVVAQVGSRSLSATELSSMLPYGAKAEERQLTVENWV